MSVKCPA
jgi:hypothetical protein